MKFKHQIITACLIGFLFGGVTSVVKAQQERPTWMIELPKVMYLKNKLWIVWVQSKYAIQVTGIFCSLDEDLV